jgi:dethiobiotin synthetase
VSAAVFLEHQPICFVCISLAILLPMPDRILFIIGTDTGVGKTVLTALLTQRLQERGVRVAALKPLCSGGRDDARILHNAAGKVLTLDEVNPWHFRAPLAPLLAARMEKKSVKLREVVRHIRNVHNRFEKVIVEGAGGLLSPLGEDFDSRDCLLALRATPILACPNQLGAINQVRLVLKSLPEGTAKKMQIVLMSPGNATSASRSNLKLLGEFIERSRLHEIPRLRKLGRTNEWRLERNIKKRIDALLDAV